MSEPSDLLRNTLTSQGHSLTAARRAVFGAMINKEPQTMQQLVAACPDVDRASVYRTVGLFEQTGIINRLQIGWKYKLELSDAFHGHHHHLTCQQCGRTITFHESPGLEAAIRQIAVDNEFSMKGHQLEIQGTCPACQA